MNEDRLLEQALAGDGEAFSRLLFPLRGPILNLAWRMTGDAEDAREVAQEAVIRIFRYLPSFRRGRPFRTWVLGITVNTARDARRKKMRDRDMHRRWGQEASFRTTDDPERRLHLKEIRERIRLCLEGLTPGERMVFLLRDGQGLDIRETAHVLRSTSASVRTRLSRARRKIRDRMNSQAGNGEKS